MDRKYDLTVQIGGYKKEREAAIRRACKVEWPFRDYDFAFVPAACGDNLLLEASALGAVYDGENIDAIVATIERAVWQANGGMCHDDVQAVRLAESSGPSAPPEGERDLQAA